MKVIKTSFVLILIMVLSIAMVGCNTQSQSDYGLKKVSNAHITLDINPSIEIITNDEGLVDQVNGLNDDAIRLLVDTNFTGQSVDVVLDAILELAIEFGYIDFDLENAILISTATEKPGETEELENKVSQKVQDFIDERKINIEILKASLSATEDIKAVAEQYQISIGKVKLITYALAANKDLTLEVAAEMSVRDLNRVIKEYRNETKEFYSEEVRGTYFELKNQLLINYELQVKAFLNEQIQASTDEVFAEILTGSEATVDELKALYQEYYNALLEVKLPEEPVALEEDDEEVKEAADKERLEELTKLQAELNKEFEELFKKLRGKNSRNLSEEELQEILNRMKEITLERNELMLEINELKVAVNKGRGNRYGFEFGFKGGKNKDHKDNDDDDLEDLYEDVEDEYEDLFDELGIDLDDLEEMFEEAFKQELTDIENVMREELAKIHENFKTDSKAIKEQIKEENEILRKIWKR